jgi:hypothetical protein
MSTEWNLLVSTGCFPFDQICSSSVTRCDLMIEFGPCGPLPCFLLRIGGLAVFVKKKSL